MLFQEHHIALLDRYVVLANTLHASTTVLWPYHVEISPYLLLCHPTRSLRAVAIPNPPDKKNMRVE